MSHSAPGYRIFVLFTISRNYESNLLYTEKKLRQFKTESKARKQLLVTCQTDHQFDLYHRGCTVYANPPDIIF